MLSFLTVNLDGSLEYLFGTLGDGNANWLLLLPQGWSIGIDHMVYAVCPVILRSASLTLAFVVASLLLRISLADAGDLWQGWFFPSALCLFLAGAMAYQFGECLKAHDRLHLLQQTTGSAALPAFLIVALFSGSGQFGGMLPFGVKEAYLLIIPMFYTLFELSLIHI